MTDEPALLAAVRQHPDDDTPRLVYADWLEENGAAERAAFIRLQCEAARLPAGTKERRKAERAAEALFKAHKVEWFGPLWKKFHSSKPAVSHCRIERGFITSLKNDVREFVAHADAIARFAPCLRRVVVEHVNDAVAKLLALPFVRTAAELDLNTLHPASLAVLKDHADWGPFDALRLTFEFEDVSDTLAGLDAAPLVRAARRFDLHYGYFPHGDEAPEVGDAAAQEPSLREMRRLKLPNLRGFGFYGMSADSAREVAAWPGFKQLDWLDFETCGIDDAAAVSLLTAKTLPRLTRLNLNENDLSTPTAEALAACKPLAGLTELALDWNSLQDAAAKKLAASTVLPAELPVDVSFNRLTEKGIAALRKRFGSGVVSREQLT
ncbi:Uncharacterized protein OS=Nitrospina gracilis (strain 3/211) GN=NITGR_1010043 PE=4 SV=1: LRR_6 [Gemmataceae bacterium]|nr:Uncharacterized protein OS=Nitrospina gracilis (strain 3/211) GN=NITGR_1010043 PE=4 SV=1: LRR_6 [Gemmataceae bacterium]VTU00234.1 Uncharacterized protein OS=Nitrospina gracilis (strain 3/211) GN=NITGR_1010043 PE=4 SV=1: LRR_6 [Gemmataceae bacterium]